MHETGLSLKMGHVTRGKHSVLRRRCPSVASILLPVALTLLAGCPGRTQTSASSELRKVFDEEWEFRVKEFPLFATHAGDHRFDDKLPSVTESDAQRRVAKARYFLEQLRSIDRGSLNEMDRVNYEVFGRLLTDRVASYEFRDYLMPITNRDGFHVSFPQLPNRVPLASLEGYENYIARLRSFGTYADQHIEIMRKGIAEGYTLPKVVLEGIDGTLTPHIVADPTDSLLFKPFTKFPESFSEAEREQLLSGGKEAIRDSVVAGYRRFLDFIQKEYVLSARQEIAAAALPEGRSYYEYLVRHFTTLEVTPKEIHEIGLREVARIRGEMQSVIEKTGFQGNFPDFLQFLRTDRRFYADCPDQLIEKVSYILKKMDGKLPQLFATLPRMTYTLEPVPDYIAPKTTTAYYEMPAGDGSKAGVYFLNTYDLQSRPLYEMESLSFHEAVPGHHLQLALQQELEDVPDFRRFLGFTVFVEGWALYAERLGRDVGFYQDPYSEFGRLTYEMWRACRLVVDTGIHYFGWARQQAIDYMAERTALTMHNITTEVDRYISWPGQALAYKIGELKIRALRAQAEQALGAAFDVRKFHDVVLLSGSVPLTVLESNVRAYIASQN